MGWLLILGLKEGLVECATVCIKSEVILSKVHHALKWCQFTTPRATKATSGRLLVDFPLQCMALKSERPKSHISSFNDNQISGCHIYVMAYLSRIAES